MRSRFGRGIILQILAMAAGAAVHAGAAHAQSFAVEPVMLNGIDSQKKIIAVLGDGYAAADQKQYAQDVQKLLMDGVFRNDDAFLKEHTAFNVYRVNVVSTDSGVTQRTYDEKGTPTDTSDDVVSMETAKNTALGYVYSGSWSHCWLQGSASTETKIQDILSANVPNADYVVVLLNENGFGGCGGGGRQVVTRSMTWQVLAHEFGHGVGGLYDEYTKDRAYTGKAVTSRNCSTVKSAATISWKDLLNVDLTVIPTAFDAAAMDPVESVGIFEGCSTYSTGIYRPVHDCRMRGNSHQFCPICRGILHETLAAFLDKPSDYSARMNAPGALCRPAGGGAITYTDKGQARNDGESGVRLICPGRRLSDDAGGFSTLVFGTAFVVDRNPTEDVCCRVQTKNPRGATITGPDECSTGALSGYQQLNLDLPKVYDKFSFSHFYVSCSVPPASGGLASSVLTYRVTQQAF